MGYFFRSLSSPLAMDTWACPPVFLYAGYATPLFVKKNAKGLREVGFKRNLFLPCIQGYKYVIIYNMKLASLFLAVFLFLPSGALGADSGEGRGLEIGRMRVALWPEYDSTGVLFIYDGRFKNNESFPNVTSFYIPSGSVISDACSLSPGGTHFCQLYKQKRFDGGDEVTLKLPYPDFYLSFHTDPFSAGQNRALHHVIKAGHRMDRLEVDIQSPLRAEAFRVLSPAGFEKTEARGFDHYGKVFENVEKGETINIDIEYVKKDGRPSVDIKYSPMSQGPRASPYQRQKGFFNIAYLVVAAGVVLLVALVILSFKSKGKDDKA